MPRLLESETESMSMGLSNFIRVTTLLRRISNQPSVDRPHPHVEENPSLTIAGVDTPFDVYTPRRTRIRGTILALHGVTGQAGRDRRLKHFARCLARSGAAVVVPSLAGLGDFQWRLSDIEDLVAIIKYSTDHHPQPFGLFGFSYGGSYSLLAAADERVADKIRFVVSIGAYYNLNDVSAWYVETDAKPAITERELDDSLYLRLVLAAQHPELLKEPAVEHPQVIDLLRRYCNESSAEEKKAFYDSHVGDPDLVRRGHELTDKELLQSLSPAGKLATIRAAVRIIHDKTDSVVPASHAPLLEAELRAIDPPINLEMLVTSLLSHVDLGDLFKFGEVRRLLSAMMPIFQG